MGSDTHTVANSTAEWLRTSVATRGSHSELRRSKQRTGQSWYRGTHTTITPRRLPWQPKRQPKGRTTKLLISISGKKNYTIIRSSIIGENPGSSTPKFLIQVVSFLDQYITHLAEASFGDESMQRADVTKFPPISRPYVKHLTKIINYKLKWAIVTVT